MLHIYNTICLSPTTLFIGERLFAHHVYKSTPFFNENGDLYIKNITENIRLTRKQLVEIDNQFRKCVSIISEFIIKNDYKIVGVTSTFEQTSAGLSILKNIKTLEPDIITIIGGANCDGEMAEGISEVNETLLNNSVDYIFSGECETIFPQFLTTLANGKLPENKILEGVPCKNLDDIPLPDYTEFFEQKKKYFKIHENESILTQIPYESSRGCWWGEKYQCKFCGLNGSNINFREKSPAKVLADFKKLIEKYENITISMVDNIMPNSYFKKLLPLIKKELPQISLFL